METRLKNGGGKFVRSLVEQTKNNDEIIEKLYLAALCRRPREIELQRAKEFIAARNDRNTSLEDIAWSVLNFREFVFRH